MKSLLDERFQSERRRYAFVFACEECVYFAARESRCAHGYPNEPHRRAAFEPDATVDAMFCKEFEIA